MTAALTVSPTPAALAREAAERFAAAAGAAIRARGRFTVALSGGTTPRALYALLASEPYRSRVDWPRIEWFWGDERCVPPGHPASNYRMAREALLDHVPVAAQRVHRMRGEDPPESAAAAYERELRTALGTPSGPPGTAGAPLDLVLLGMGEDGHTASLFPGGSAVHERERWAVAQYSAAAAMWRLTLTPVVINAAAAVLFLVEGAAKAATLARVLDGPRSIDLLPSQAIAPREGPRWLVDAAAASGLSRERRA